MASSKKKVVVKEKETKRVSKRLAAKQEKSDDVRSSPSFSNKRDVPHPYED